MANRFPLTLDPLAQQIRELDVGDSLDLTGNTVSSDLTPLVPGTYSLGGLGFQWLDMHADNIYGMLQTGSQPGITEVGTISAGQWQADPISPQFGGTGTALIPVAGSLVFTNSSSLALTSVGTSGQVLRANGPNAPSWTSSINLEDLTISSSLHMLDRKAIRFYEGGGGPNYVEVRAPLTIGSDYLLNLPASDGSAGEVLTTDGAGNLSWAGNAGTFIQNGDSSVFVTDPGVGGAIGFKTDNFTRWEIDSAGRLFPSTGSTYDLGLAGQRIASVYSDDLYGTIMEGSQTNIVGVGTITTGTWNGTIIDPSFGGTGVSNPSGRTITLGGSIVTSSSFQTAGNFGITLTATGATNVTLPTSGTLLTSGVTSLPSLQSTGTLLSLTVSGTALLQADATIGSSGSNTLTINSRIATDLVPDTDSARDLGSATTAWADAFVDRIASSVDIGTNSANTVTFTARVGSSVLPSADDTYDLGSATYRWANIYTGDLHLKNDRGDWTLIEEEDALTIRNNKTGKVYDIMMSPRKA
jgi:hypothetical protein